MEPDVIFLGMMGPVLVKMKGKRSDIEAIHKILAEHAGREGVTAESSKDSVKIETDLEKIFKDPDQVMDLMDFYHGPSH